MVHVSLSPHLRGVSDLKELIFLAYCSQDERTQMTGHKDGLGTTPSFNAAGRRCLSAP